MVSVESESLSKSDEVGGSRVGDDDCAAEGTEKVNGDVNDADSASAVEANGETLPSVDSSEPDSKVVATPPQDGSSASDAVPAPTSTLSCETTAKKGGVHISGRGITLEMLLKDGFVKPGPGALTVELEGKKRKGTLLKNGHIQDETSDTTFTSVTAWAIYACNALSPAFKPPSGTTWCSQIRHKGKSLDHYKCQWCYMRQDKHKRGDFGDRSFSKKKRVVRPEEAGVRPGCEADRDLLIQCQPFQRYGKMQPFNVTVSLSAYILMDLHSSITLNEVSGYLGGTWDLNNHILHVKAAYPCRCRPGDSENAAMVEYDIAMNMEKANHTVVGWYHSHPQFPPYPSIADTECQLEYQMKMKGNTDAAYTPCVGMITAPFQDDSGSLETIVGCFWVMPPPETRPMDPPIPMLLEYLPVPEPLPDRDVEEAKLLFDFYKESSEFINSVHILRDEVTYWDKLESTLKPKLMAAENGPKLWDVIYNAFIEPDESNVVDVVEPQVKQEAPVVHEEEEEPKMEEVPEAVEVPPKEGNDSVDDAAPVVGLIEESTERVEQVEEEPNLLENPSQDEHDVEVPIVETDTPLATPLQGSEISNHSREMSPVSS